MAKEFKLSFKPVNISHALNILTQDLKNDKMSTEIIHEIGEVFIKHMFYKQYEEKKEEGKTEYSSVSTVEFNDFIEYETKLNNTELNSSSPLNNSELNSSSPLNNETNSEIKTKNEVEDNNLNYLNTFNEKEEAKKLMKYLSLGWYIYTYCL
jgi:hypothetical protein